MTSSTPASRTHFLFCHATLDTETFAERAEAAAAAGRSGLALDYRHYRAYRERGETDAEMVRICRANGVAVEEIWSFYGALEATDPRRQLAFMDKLLAIADIFGARMIGTPSGPDADFGTAADRLAAACDRAARSGVRIGLEFVAFGALRDLTTTARIVSATQRDNIGIILDCWHFFRGHPDLAALATLPGHLLEAVQLNDGYRAPRVPDPLEEVRRFRTLPGDGEFDVESLVRIVDRVAPGVRWCIEASTDELAALPARAAAERARTACQRFLDRARESR
ncbi:MAG TPA: TIM barrel protein [Amycolatopsis sp.]|nr:TIM barrel protein [Amycolatopsis sp.]